MQKNVKGSYKGVLCRTNSVMIFDDCDSQGVFFCNKSLKTKVLFMEVIFPQ